MNTTELCEIAYKYGTDKCPQIGHTYTPWYYEAFKDKRASVKKVLEIGVGYEWKSNAAYYQWGASLKMWREFFPNAHIYGIDIKPEVILQDDRISTFLCDATEEEQLKALIGKIGSDLDIVIDDGCHHTEHQILTAKLLMPLLKEDVIYIIEDVAMNRKLRNGLPEYEVITLDIPPKPPRVPGMVNRNKLLWIKRR